MATRNRVLTYFCWGESQLKMQYVILESYICDWCCYLITQLTNASKYHNEISLVALNILVARQQQKITFFFTLSIFLIK